LYSNPFQKAYRLDNIHSNCWQSEIYCEINNLKNLYGTQMPQMIIRHLIEARYRPIDENDLFVQILKYTKRVIV